MRHFIIICILFCFMACHPNKDHQQASAKSPVWQKQLDSILPLYGHRNWVLVVDKAFPALAASSGMTIINTGADMLPVLRYTLNSIQTSTHVKALIFEDKELGYIHQEQIPSIGSFKDSLAQLFAGQTVSAMLHDSVFTHLSQVAGAFQILVLKTNSTSAYSSVYFQLDCKYWDSSKENQLRRDMKQGN